MYINPLNLLLIIFQSIFGGLIFLLLSLTLAHASSATCILPYNEEISPESAKIVAKSIAYLQTIDEVEQEIKNNKAISFGLKNKSLRKAMVAELYKVNSHVKPYSLNYSTGDVQVTVSIQPEENLNQVIANTITKHDLLDMRLELLNLLQEYTKKGQDLIFIQNGILKNTTQKSKLAMKNEIAIIAQRLRALWLYSESLDYFNETWENPKLVQQKLQTAVELDAGLAPIWAALGEVQLQMDQPQNALQSLNHALNLKPNMARVFYMRGLGHLRLQQPALAMADLDTALKFKPDQVAWLRARGAIAMVLEDFIGMCGDFEAACALGDCEGLIHARKNQLCLP